VSDIFERLRAPFPPDRVSWRIGSTTADKSRGMALAYIDSRDVQDRLDEVVGPQNWQNRFPHVGEKTVCEIGILFDGSWIWKSDGAGNTDVEAEKGALSDSFKRAAVKFGIGRYFYDLESPWVDIEPAGKSFKIRATEYARLRSLLAGAPPKPEHQFLSETQASKVADELINNLNGCVSWAEFDQYKRSDAFKALFVQLPQKHRSRIQNIGIARAEKLKRAVDELA
jgi:hypothetical protein